MPSTVEETEKTIENKLKVLKLTQKHRNNRGMQVDKTNPETTKTSREKGRSAMS